MLSLSLRGLVALSTFLCGTSALAQDDTINADRPGIADGSSVIGRNRFQVEIGFQEEWHRDGANSERDLFLPLLLRFGIGDLWEFRIESNTLSQGKFYGAGGNFTTSDFSPLSFGWKYQFQKPAEGSSRPSLGLIGRVFPPTGSGAFGSRRTSGDLRFALDQDIAPGWSINANLGFGVYETDGDGSLVTGLAALTLSFAPNARFSAFLDGGLQTLEQPSGKSALILDFGATYLLSKNLQADISFGTGVIGRSVPRPFWSAGLSARF